MLRPVGQRIGKSLLALTAAMAAAAGAAQAGSLTVELSGVTSTAGNVLVSICEEARFRGQCAESRMVQAARGTVTVVFADLAPGRYAAKAFHDENDNRKLDTTAEGIPTEGIGFSNNAPSSFGPARFGDAVFEMGAGDQKIRFRINY